MKWLAKLEWLVCYPVAWFFCWMDNRFKFLPSREQVANELKP